MVRSSAHFGFGAITFFTAVLAGCVSGDVTIEIEGTGNWKLEGRSNITSTKPGFLFLPKEIPNTLLINGFDATPIFGKGSVSTLDLTEQNPEVQQLTNIIDWPNYITVIPEEIFGFQALLIGAGFLVPSHETGGVWVMESSADPQHLKTPVKITEDEGGYFYHRGELLDMNGDGLVDIVTARCHYEVYPWSTKGPGELVWLEHPNSSTPLEMVPWERYLLHDGPDFLFAPQPLSKEFIVAAAEYTSEKIAVYSLVNNLVVERVVDADSGPGFSVSWVDVNNDGKLDLLATNHLNQNGSVYVYTWDGDITKNTTSITKHVIATGFSAITTSTGTAAPGDALAFQPKSGLKTKPWIFVSGDNGNTIVLLRPMSEDSSNFLYNKQILADVGADVGQNVIGDVDGDGFSDVFVPAYDLNKIIQYEFVDF